MPRFRSSSVGALGLGLEADAWTSWCVFRRKETQPLGAESILAPRRHGRRFEEEKKNNLGLGRGVGDLAEEGEGGLGRRRLGGGGEPPPRV